MDYSSQYGMGLIGALIITSIWVVVTLVVMAVTGPIALLVSFGGGAFIFGMLYNEKDDFKDSEKTYVRPHKYGPDGALEDDPNFYRTPNGDYGRTMKFYTRAKDTNEIVDIWGSYNPETNIWRPYSNIQGLYCCYKYDIDRDEWQEIS